MSSFWSQPLWWPPNPRGQVFLLRAVEEIGRACYVGWPRLAEAASTQPRIVETIIRDMIEACRAGRVLAVARNIDSGEQTPINPDWWHSLQAREWFEFGRMNPADAYGARPEWNRDDARHQIFIERDGLDEFLRRATPASARPTPTAGPLAVSGPGGDRKGEVAALRADANGRAGTRYEK